MPHQGWGAWDGSYPAAAPKPGVVPLRPLSVGEILDGAVSAMRTHWRTMFGLSAVVVTVAQVIQVLVTWALLRDADLSVLENTALPLEQILDPLVRTTTAAGVGVVVTWLAQLVLTGVLTMVVSRAVLGWSIRLKEALSATVPRLPALFGLTLLVGLICGGAVILGAAIPTVPLLALRAPEALVVLLAVLGGLAGLLAGIYLYVTFALGVPALMLEQQPIRTALRRSHRLVRGSWWRVFGILALAWIITVVISYLVQVPFTLLASPSILLNPSETTQLPTDLVSLTLLAIGGIIAGTIAYPFSAGVGVLLYVDQRIRREALDLDLARAAGAAGTPAAPQAHIDAPAVPPSVPPHSGDTTPPPPVPPAAP